MDLEVLNIIANLILVGTLVVVTTYYAFQTKKIVDETRKDRKVRHLEHRLVFVYSPLLRLIDEGRGKKIQVGGEFGKGEMICLRENELEEIRDILKGYSYLISEQLKVQLSNFLPELGYDYDYNFEVETLDNLHEIVSKEYASLLERYSQLVGN